MHTLSSDVGEYMAAGAGEGRGVIALHTNMIALTLTIIAILGRNLRIWEECNLSGLYATLPDAGMTSINRLLLLYL